MADLAIGDVTVVVQDRVREDRKHRVLAKITFGDGALTYPSGGVPVPTYEKFGMYRTLDYLIISDGNDASGYTWKYDKENKKLRAWQSAGFTPAGTNSAPTFTGSALAVHGHTLHLNNADVLDGTTTTVNAGTDLLGANTGSDIAVTTVADTTGRGGIVSITAGTPAGTVAAPTFTGTAVAAGVMAELGNVAVAAQTLYVEAVGF